MTTEKSLVTREQGFDIMPIEFLKQQTRQLEELYKGLMQEGTDYGKVPGTDKPTLFKSGAELLRLRARLDPKFAVDSSGTDLVMGIFCYQVTCDLYRDGEHIGAGVGSCNSLESKYRYRWVFESALPKGIDKTTLPSKKFQSKGRWYVTYRIENENPQDLANTILKMAKKRAFVDAILTVTGASRIFTQDIEDMVDEVPTTEETKPSPQEQPKSEKPKAQPKAQEEGKEESQAEPSDVQPEMLGFIDKMWLREQLNILQGKKLSAWTNRNLLSYLNNITGQQSEKVADAVKLLNKEQAEALVLRVREAVELA